MVILLPPFHHFHHVFATFLHFFIIFASFCHFYNLLPPQRLLFPVITFQRSWNDVPAAAEQFFAARKNIVAVIYYHFSSLFSFILHSFFIHFRSFLICFRHFSSLFITFSFIFHPFFVTFSSLFRHFHHFHHYIYHFHH